MYRRAAIVSMFLMGAGAATAARATAVTTYGTGLQSCGAYLNDREQQNADEVDFVDWLSGYLSGVNATSSHTNNILGDSDLTGAIHWLDNYCHLNPRTRFAAAVDARVAPNRRDK
jgi:hypothetical protein